MASSTVLWRRWEHEVNNPCSPVYRLVRERETRKQGRRAWPPGLPNQTSNLCFLNALLQALSSSSSFLFFLESTLLFVRLHERPSTTEEEQLEQSEDEGEVWEDGDRMMLQSLRVVLSYLDNREPQRLGIVGSRQTWDELLHDSFSGLQWFFEHYYKIFAPGGAVSVRHGGRNNNGGVLGGLGPQDPHEALMMLLGYLVFELVFKRVNRELRYPALKLLATQLTACEHRAARMLGVWAATATTGRGCGDAKEESLCALENAYHLYNKKSHAWLRSLCSTLLGYTFHTTVCRDCGHRSRGPSLPFVMYELPLEQGYSPVALEKVLYDDLGRSTLVDDVECVCCTVRRRVCDVAFWEHVATMQASEPFPMMEAELSCIKSNAGLMHFFNQLSEFWKKALLVEPVHRTQKVMRSYLQDVPFNLVFHISRSHGANEKNARFVRYPFRLDMGPFVYYEEPGDHQRLIYELKAIVEHTGTHANDGHFVTYKRWDTVVSPFEKTYSTAVNMAATSAYRGDAPKAAQLFGWLDTVLYHPQTLTPSPHSANATTRNSTLLEFTSSPSRSSTTALLGEDVYRTTGEEKWVRISDDAIEPVTKMQALACEAYTLHYQRWSAL